MPVRGYWAFSVLPQGVSLTMAQVIVLGAVMLIYHSLPLKVRVTQRDGACWGIVF